MSVDSSENSEVGVELPVTKRRTVDRRSAIDRVTSKPRHWRPAEDEGLRRAVQKLGEKNWKAIAKHVEGRNHTQCFQRWYKVLCPGLKKGKWSPEEDELLKKLATEQLEACDKDNLPRKLNWGVVCKHIIGRTAKQCRERWVNNLNPEIKKGRWTREEDNLILKLNEQYPKKWALIAKHLQGRTENSVKIRYHTLVRIGNLEDEPDDASVKGQKRKRPFDAKESEKPEKKELKATGQLPEGLAADMAKAYQYPVRPFAPQPGYFIPQGYMPGFDYTGNAFNGKLMQPMMPNFAPMPDAQVAPQFAGGQLLGPNPGMNYGMLPPQLQGQMYLNQGMQFVSQFPVV